MWVLPPSAEALQDCQSIAANLQGSVRSPGARRDSAALYVNARPVATPQRALDGTKRPSYGAAPFPAFLKQAVQAPNTSSQFTIPASSTGPSQQADVEQALLQPCSPSVKPGLQEQQSPGNCTPRRKDVGTRGGLTSSSRRSGPHMASTPSLQQQKRSSSASSMAHAHSLPQLPDLGIQVSQGPELNFISAHASKQHPAKSSSGIPNADAVNEASTLLGICDGVSGVHDMGIPPQTLPHELLDTCRARIEPWTYSSTHADDDEETGAELIGLIEEAYDATSALGATTLLLAAIRNGNKLFTTCLGDCALLLLRPCGLRNLQVVYRSEPGRYDPRRPVQVQRLPGVPDSNAHYVIQGAQVDIIQIHKGDVLVLGSDGLFDNLCDEEMKNIVEQWCCCSGCNSTVVTANVRAAAALLVETAIASVHPEVHGGGVPDDTTALVALVDQVDRQTHMVNSDVNGSRASLQAPSRQVNLPLKVLQDRTNEVVGNSDRGAAGGDKQHGDGDVTPARRPSKCQLKA